MPLAIALLVRSIVQLGVTLAIYTTAEAFIKAALDALPKILSNVFGISEQESRDFIHDFMIDQALTFGITVLALRKQMPTIVAERLGFTSKGFNKFGFSAGAKKKIEEKIGMAIPDNLAAGTGYWKLLGKFMGAITAVFMLTQSVEVFAYRPQFFTNILDFVGLGDTARKVLIPPKTPLFSPLEIKQYATGFGISEEEAKGLFEAAEDTVRRQIKVPTQSNVLKILREDLLKTTTTPSVIPTPTAPVAVAPARVFTGIVSQGVLGAGLNFTPRPDDLIENTEELTTAAHNNLAPWLAALPAKLYYEIKIVSSVKAAGEFVQKSTSQRIISGYYKNGTPKYKIVFNKFAIMDILVLTASHKFVKISSIVLGPVDAIKFQGGNINLQGVATDVKQNIVAPTIDIPTTPATATTPTPAPSAVATPPVIIPTPATPTAPIQTPIVSTGLLGSAGQRTAMINGVAYLTNNAGDIYNQAGQRVQSTASGVVLAPVAVPIVSQQVATSPKMGANATTLYEWYTAQGQNLPSVQARSTIYANLGLGQATYYTGTAEQNTKLLAALKAK